MTATASTPRASGWLYGPVPDLLLGCGLLYALLFVAFALFGPSLRALQPSFLIPVLILLVSMPHYGGTLVRVYDQRRDRRSYALFSVWATLLIAALFVWGTFASVVASWLFTVYITWSPWHYTGQNYGLAVMFLRRRGVPLSTGVKRLFYASFLLAYGLTFLVFHSAISLIDYNTSQSENAPVAFLPLGIPPALHRVLFPLAAAAYAATLAATAALLLRRARVRDLVPAAALALTQALWFSIPFAVRYFGVSTGLEPVDLLRNRIEDYFKWVALGHAAQYLWVTSYYARGSGSWRGFPRYFGKVLASGVAVWTLPVLLFAPLVRGRYEYAGGLALLVASAVNLHHFVLDGAIWKLRNSRIASVLIRAEPERPAGLPEPVAPRKGWLRPAVWVAATAGLAVGVSVLWLEDFALRAAFLRSDYAGLNRVLDRMAWLGRDNSAARLLAARGAARAGDWEESLAAHRAALAMSPDQPELQARIVWLARRLDDPARTVAQLRDALRLAPGSTGMRNELAWTLATSRDARIRDPDQAVRLAESLVHSSETPDLNWLDTLAAAYAAAGRFDDAVRLASQASALAQAQGEAALGEQIRARLALYRERRAFLEADAADGA
ncbi:MAG: tetratricopeptide repeat protein [Candidatus Limnocylindria bacterium]